MVLDLDTHALLVVLRLSRPEGKNGNLASWDSNPPEPSPAFHKCNRVAAEDEEGLSASQHEDIVNLKYTKFVTYPELRRRSDGNLNGGSPPEIARSGSRKSLRRASEVASVAASKGGSSSSSSHSGQRSPKAFTSSSSSDASLADHAVNAPAPGPSKPQIVTKPKAALHHQYSDIPLSDLQTPPNRNAKKTISFAHKGEGGGSQKSALERMERAFRRKNSKKALPTHGMARYTYDYYTTKKEKVQAAKEAKYKIDPAMLEEAFRFGRQIEYQRQQKAAIKSETTRASPDAV
jgi:hypothetical protein